LRGALKYQQGLDQANIDRLILCVRMDYSCDANEFSKRTQVVRFNKQLDPKDVLEILEGSSGFS
jgi:hypothetical protein